MDDSDGQREGSRQQLLAQRHAKPVAVPPSAPVAVDDEQTVHLGRHGGVGDVGRLRFGQAGAQRTEACERPRQSTLPDSTLPLDVAEQARRCGIGLGGARQDPIDAVASAVDRRRDFGEPGDQALRIGLGEQVGDLGRSATATGPSSPPATRTSRR